MLSWMGIILLKQHIAFLLQEWQKNRPNNVLGAHDTTLLPETSKLTKRITCGILWSPSQEPECDENPKRRVCRLFCKVEGKHDAQRNLAGRYSGYFLICSITGSLLIRDIHCIKSDPNVWRI